MLKKSHKSIRELLPWYLNGSLTPKERIKVMEAISRDEKTRSETDTWELIRTVLVNQPFVEPSSLVQRRIMASLHEPVTASRQGARMRWSALAGAIVTLSVLIFLWLAVRPGVVLQWSIERDAISSYRIYRAPQGSSQFELLKEIPSQANQWQYRFVDALLVPGKDYVYRVEGIRPNGVSTFSQVVKGRSLDLLPGQLALIISSAIIGYSLVALVQRFPLSIYRKV